MYIPSINKNYLTEEEDCKLNPSYKPSKGLNNFKDSTAETSYQKALMTQFKLQQKVPDQTNSHIKENKNLLLNPIPYDTISQTDDISLLLKYFKPMIIEIDILLKSDNYKVQHYKNGIYFGQMNLDIREKEGILLYSDGRIYEGSWLQDQKSGRARDLFPNGNYYIGDYLRGERDGKGQFVWTSGERYDGEWRQNKKQGSGVWKGVKGDSYVGEWQMSQPHGFGVHRWLNGDRYEGQFQQGLKHGQGIEKFSNGDTYDGQYSYGKPCGFGIYKWLTGEIFKGNFLNGLRHGKGKWIGKGNIYIYTGEYQNDKKCGDGIYDWNQNGQRYVGQFYNDLRLSQIFQLIRHGYGRLESDNGSYLEGQWVNGIHLDGDGQMGQFQSIISEGEMQFKKESKSQYKLNSKPQKVLPPLVSMSQQHNNVNSQKHHKTLDNSIISPSQSKQEAKNFSLGSIKQRTIPQPQKQAEYPNYISLDSYGKTKPRKQYHWIPGGVHRNHNPIGYNQRGNSFFQQ